MRQTPRLQRSAASHALRTAASRRPRCSKPRRIQSRLYASSRDAIARRHAPPADSPAPCPVRPWPRGASRARAPRHPGKTEAGCGWRSPNAAVPAAPAPPACDRAATAAGSDGSVARAAKVLRVPRGILAPGRTGAILELHGAIRAAAAMHRRLGAVRRSGHRHDPRQYHAGKSHGTALDGRISIVDRVGATCTAAIGARSCRKFPHQRCGMRRCGDWPGSQLRNPQKKKPPSSKSWRVSV